MRTPLFVVALLLMPSFAFAGDVTAPVKTVIDITASNWSGEEGDGGDIFSEDMLTTLYSKDFVAKYREAAKFPAYDDGGSPFGYDVITMGQDGCPLEGISITPGETKNGVTDVLAKFKNTTCFGSEPEYQAFSEVHFDVVEEDGRPVIDDIHTLLENDVPGSLKEEMVIIANQ